MEEGEIQHHHEEEVKSLNINMGNKETESSGHTINIELLELVETMRA